MVSGIFPRADGYSLCPFSNWATFGFLSVRSSLHVYSGRQYPLRAFMSVSPTLWLSFHPPAQAFHSDEVYPLFLLPVLLVSYQINHCQIQCHEDFSLFSSKSFMVLVLKFRSLFHFELILEYSVRKGPNFMLLHVEIQFSYHRLLKRRSFPPRGGPGALAEARVIYCGFILGSVLVRGLRVCSVPVPRKSSRCDLLLPRLFGMFRVL